MRAKELIDSLHEVESKVDMRQAHLIALTVALINQGYDTEDVVDEAKRLMREIEDADSP